MIDDSKRFALAPAYDVLPMVYWPMDGAVPTRPFTPPTVIPGVPSEWPSALEFASLFWDRTKSDVRISEGFRMICSENYNAVQGLYASPRLFA